MDGIRQQIRKIRWSLSWKRIDTAEIHRTCMIDSRTIIGKYVVLFSDVALDHSAVGDFSYIAQSTICTCTLIGKYCSIAADVVIGLQDHPMNFISTSPVFYDSAQPLPQFFTTEKNEGQGKNTMIGNDVWIGNGVRIKSGLTVGTGAIIGAGSVVTKDVAPYTVVGGVPAKFIKRRFSEELSKRLLESKWWDLDPHVLRELAPYFNDPGRMIDLIEGKK